MRRFTLLASLPVLFCAGQAIAATSVDGLRAHAAPERTRIVFDLGRPVEHRLFALADPHRLVIDIENSRLNADLPAINRQGSRIRAIRTAPRNQGRDLRVVLDLHRPVTPKSFLLPPAGQYGHRLVVDLYDLSRPVVKKPEIGGIRNAVIAIDAGHGGDDPGAIGPGGLREKDVVLAIVKELQRLFEREPGFSARLIRQGDYYLALRERTGIARDLQAHAFLSIHADAFRTPKVSGASVYAISHKGATDEDARWLAEKENRADLIGGVSPVPLADKDDDLVSTLVDLSRDRSLRYSLEMGDAVLDSLGKVTRLHKKDVKQARFVVLKSPDIPSLLIETGYISNPGEARKLATASHRAKLAQAIFEGVRAYMQANPPDENTYLARWKKQQGDKVITYVIERGDTLSGIASRYRVSFKKLKDFNGLQSDTIRIGQKLKIPTG